MHKVVLLFLASVVVLSVSSTLALCQGRGELAHSTWICRVEKDNDSLRFTSKTEYVYYDCELEVHSYGSYKVSADTVFLFQQYGEFDKDVPCDSQHGEGRKLFKLLWHHNTMRMIFAHHSIYDEPMTTFPLSFNFQRVSK